MVRQTASLLRACQLGAHHNDPSVRTAAESVISYLVLHLKHKQCPIPDELAGHVKTLEQNALTV